MAQKKQQPCAEEYGTICMTVIGDPGRILLRILLNKALAQHSRKKLKKLPTMKALVKDIVNHVKK